MTDNLANTLNSNAKCYIPKNKKVNEGTLTLNTNITKDNITTSKLIENLNETNINDKKIEIKDNNLDKLNLDYKPYIPKTKIEGFNVEGLEEAEEEKEEEQEEEENDEEEIENELDKIINKELKDQHDVLDLDHEEDEISDEDKWYPNYANCECCKGFIHKCENEVCKSLSVCYCKAQEDYDPEL